MTDAAYDTILNGLLTIIALLLSIVVQELRAQKRHADTIEQATEKARDQAIDSVLKLIQSNGVTKDELDRRK